MEFEDVKNEYKNILNQLAEITGQNVKDIENELDNAENMEELLKRATEIFDE